MRLDLTSSSEDGEDDDDVLSPAGSVSELVDTIRRERANTGMT